MFVQKAMKQQLEFLSFCLSLHCGEQPHVWCLRDKPRNPYNNYVLDEIKWTQDMVSLCRILH